MVNTKSELKIKIKEFVVLKEQPFKTSEVIEFSREISNNIRISPHRVRSYIQQTGAKFNKKSKLWDWKNEW